MWYSFKIYEIYFFKKYFEMVIMNMKIIKKFFTICLISAPLISFTVLLSNCSNSDPTRAEIEKCNYTVKALQIEDKSNAPKFYIGPGIHG
jgi:hypothetical protein